MSVKAVSWALEESISDPIAKLVLIGIADKYNEDRGFAWPAVKWLATAASCSTRTVQRKLLWLEGQGYINIDRRFNETNCYGLPLVNGGGVTVTPGDRAVSGGGDRAVSGGGDTSCHPNNNNNNNNKHNIRGKQKVSEWSPSDDDIAYAQQQGVDADDILTSIRLWDEQNGNKAAYASCSAFFKQWARKEGKRSQGASKGRTVGKPSDKQERLVQSLLEQAYKREKQGDPLFLGEDYDRLRKTLTQACLDGKLSEVCDAMTLRLR